MYHNNSVLDWPKGTTVYKPEKCFNGVTVVNPYRSELVFLIDMVGRVARIWHPHPTKRAESWFSKLSPNGNWLSLIYETTQLSDASSPRRTKNSFSEDAFNSSVVEVDSKENLVWEYKAPDGWLIHHDMVRLENGNTMILVEKTVDLPEISDKPIAENFIIEVSPDNEIVWKWFTTEHFNQFGYSTREKKLMAERGKDIFHTNTLATIPKNELEKNDSRFSKGNVLSCQRNTNRIFIIDKDSGEVVWTWGKEELVGPHHPVMLSNGNIIIYDNGGQAGYPIRTRFYTRLIEIEPISGNIVWEYSHEPYTYKPTSKFFSSSWGSIQRLPNGNTFSLDCHKGRLFEVTPEGEIVWEYISPFSWGWGTRNLDSGIYRAYRYGFDEISKLDEVFKTGQS